MPHYSETVAIAPTGALYIAIFDDKPQQQIFTFSLSLSLKCYDSHSGLPVPAAHTTHATHTAHVTQHA